MYNVVPQKKFQCNNFGSSSMWRECREYNKTMYVQDESGKILWTSCIIRQVGLTNRTKSKKSGLRVWLIKRIVLIHPNSITEVISSQQYQSTLKLEQSTRQFIFSTIQTPKPSAKFVFNLNISREHILRSFQPPKKSVQRQRNFVEKKSGAKRKRNKTVG